MGKRLQTACLVVVALSAAPAESGAQTTVRYEDGIFRARAGSIQVEIQGRKPGGIVPRLSILIGPAVNIGPGCRPFVQDSLTPVVHCPIIAADIPEFSLRYRITLSDGYDSGWAPHRRARGVIYGLDGGDDLHGDRVYGGPGDDELEGVNVWGGPGDDRIFHPHVYPPANVLRGGSGSDYISGPGWLYGGPGNDFLDDADFGRGDMLVGGPGRDHVEIGDDSTRDVVRLRGGDRDSLYCDGPPDPEDLFYVDRSDRVSPSCRNAGVILTGRPRSLGNVRDRYGTSHYRRDP